MQVAFRVHGEVTAMPDTPRSRATAVVEPAVQELKAGPRRGRENRHFVEIMSERWSAAAGACSRQRRDLRPTIGAATAIMDAVAPAPDNYI
jgi:hypothetical protein